MTFFSSVLHLITNFCQGQLLGNITRDLENQIRFLSFTSEVVCHPLPAWLFKCILFPLPFKILVAGLIIKLTWGWLTGESQIEFYIYIYIYMRGSIRIWGPQAVRQLRLRRRPEATRRAWGLGLQRVGRQFAGRW